MDKENSRWLLYGRERGRSAIERRVPFGSTHGRADAHLIVELMTFAKAMYGLYGDELFEATPTILEVMKRSREKWRVEGI